MCDSDTFRAQPLPSQEEVMANWQGDVEKPVVSVLCNTFNQKMYIEDAFRGFLIQKTDFGCEVIVHDDASTDGTSDIVRDYASRYPKIFKPIIQVENQYSKGKKITLISATNAKGKFCALCEGDDLWIDERKLSKQLYFLEYFSFASIVVSNGYTLKDKKLTKWGSSVDTSNGYALFSLNNILSVPGQFSPSASMFFKKEIINYIINHEIKAPVADFLIEVYSQKFGCGVYLNDYSVIYRLQTTNSWSLNMLKKTEFVRTFSHSMGKFHEKVLEDFPSLVSGSILNREGSLKRAILLSYIQDGNKEELISFLKNNQFIFKKRFFYIVVYYLTLTYVGRKILKSIVLIKRLLLPSF